MRICIVRQGDEFLGGASLYDEALIKLIKDSCSPTDVLLESKPKKLLTKSPNGSISYSLNYLTLASIALRRSKIFAFLLKKIKLNNMSFERKLKKNKIDFVIFTSPSVLALGLKETPFALPIWDFGHRELQEFYETSLNGNFENREYYYKSILPKASLILTDSQITRQKIIKIYGVNSNNVINLNFLWILSYRNNKVKKFHHAGSEKKFFIYPANFWPHKNHLLLIHAFSSFEVKSRDLALIFTGVDRGNEKKLRNLVKDLNLEKSVHFYGKLEIEKLNYLYSTCSGLLYPSLLGPSNLPPLEALIFNKVAVISSVHKSEEFYSRNFIKLDPFDLRNWIEQIIEMSTYNREISEPKFLSELHVTGARSVMKKSLEYIAHKKELINL